MAKNKVNQTRGILYQISKLLGDYNAIKKGTVGKRIGRRVVGRAAGKGIGKIFK